VTIEIVFETHSISTDNEAGIATGWLDGRLSESGRQHAGELGARRRSERVHAVHTSDLRRAVETAEIAFAGSDIEIRHDWRLRECNYGQLNGMPVTLLEMERHHHVDDPWPEGESYRQVIARVQDFLRDLSYRQSEGRFVVIGHTATRWALDHLAHGVPLETLVSSPFDWQEGWVYSFTRAELRASS
jgi:2,3-bisphosphoglycerate-dependent phosphoglycerate mutase